MPKLILNTIVKDEAHCIERMLEAAIEITDAIVINDTGSTDGTQEIIREFGKKHNIPTYVFERPFDDFEKSRNYGLDKAREVVKELKWDPDNCWTWWCDADEFIVIDDKFSKKQFDKDLFMINTQIGRSKYTRNTFARVSKPFYWYGPIHEFITYDKQKYKMTSGLASNIFVSVTTEGNSWKQDVSLKYKTHATILEKYIDEDRKDPRWIFYTAQSWHDSARTNIKEENEERLRRSIKYYKERVSRLDGYHEERFYAQYKIGAIMERLQLPWKESKQELLKAYSMDPHRVEPLNIIINHYMGNGEWNMAYLYSKSAVSIFHGKNPYPNRLLFIDEVLYEWKLLELHAANCFYTNRKDEAKKAFNEMLDVLTKKPHLFSESDIEKIENNKKFYNE